MRGAAVDLAILLPSWQLHLRAERKSPDTVESYGDGERRFLVWADGEGRPQCLTGPASTPSPPTCSRPAANRLLPALGSSPSGASRPGCSRRARATLTTCSASRRPSWTLTHGVPLDVVSEILGHSSIAMTGDVHGHVAPDVSCEAVDTPGGAVLGE